MNKKMFLFPMILFVLLAAFEKAEALLHVIPNSVAITSRTVAASAYFVSRDTTPPCIHHRGISQVSRYNPLVIIEGTATDDDTLRAIMIYYRIDGMNVSTKTFTISDGRRTKLTPLTTSFYFQVNVSDYLKGIDESIQNFYYTISAVDDAGNYVMWSENSVPSYGYVRYRRAPVPGFAQFKAVGIGARCKQKIGVAGGVIALDDGSPNTGKTSLELPQGALSGDVDIKITELNPSLLNSSGNPSLLSSKPLAAYQFEPGGLVFNKPVKMNLLYRDVNNIGVYDGTKYKVESLKVMWWDGFEWRLIGGKVDTDNKLVSCNVTHFSVYGIFPANAISNLDSRPREKIITPALIDNKNDFATFDNLNQGETITIYDITGKKIRFIDGTNVWDGKDESGNIVESGLYIYQIKKADKVISGTIVVAK